MISVCPSSIPTSLPNWSEPATEDAFESDAIEVNLILSVFVAKASMFLSGPTHAMSMTSSRLAETLFVMGSGVLSFSESGRFA